MTDMHAIDSIDRRQLLKYGAITGSGLTLAGCIGGDNGSDSNSDELVILSKETTDESVQWFDQVANQFEEENGTQVTVDYAGLDLIPVATSMIQTGNPPDLATLAMDQVGPFIESDQLEDVNDIVTMYEEEYGEIPESERLLQDDNEYLIPLWSNPTQLWFWADIYEEYGFDTEPGVTWDELREIAQTIHEGEEDMYGFTIPLGGDRQTGYFFWNFLASNGGQICHVDDGEIDIAIDIGENRDRVIETLEFLVDMHQFSPEGTDYAWTENLETFTSRTSAHCLYGPRAKLSIIDQREQFIDQVQPHYPVSNRDEGTLLNLPDGFSLFSASENKQGAREFNQFIAEGNHLIELLTSVSPVHNWPTISAIAESDEYREDDFISGNFSETELNTIASGFNDSISFVNETEMLNPYAPSLLGSAEIDNMVYDVVAEGTAPEQAIDEYADTLRNTLNDLRG